MTLSIDLEPSALAALNRQAADLGIRVEELAGRILNRQSQEPVTMDDAAFREALAASFRANDAAYRILAQ